MESIDINGITYRYYVADRKMDRDEDDMVEFKGHLNFTKEQVPDHARDPTYNRPSRQPISKTMNAMLNSKTGGTIYIGVNDGGVVSGVVLSQYKMDHIEQNVFDVMKRYSPPVPSHRYSINFVPVINESITDVQSILLYDPIVHVEDAMRSTPHHLRSAGRCWCDRELGAHTHNGLLHLQYVIELVIHAWDPADPRNDGLALGKMRAHPVHSNEECRAYYRCSASIREFTVMELMALATKTVVDHYDPILHGLHQEREKLIEDIHAALDQTRGSDESHQQSSPPNL